MKADSPRSTGTEVAYRDYGDPGDGLVLLHGRGVNLESMDGLARLLGVDHRVASLDVRCCGQPADPDRFSLEDAATDVEALIEFLGLPDAEEAAESAAWASQARHALELMTTRRRVTRRGWKSRSHGRSHGSTSFSTAQLTLRQRPDDTVALGNGLFRRHPARRVLDPPSADASRSMTHMFEQCAGPVLVIYCTLTGWPAGLERELEGLARKRPNVLVRHLVARHTAPVWKEADATVTLIRHFLGTAGSA